MWLRLVLLVNVLLVGAVAISGAVTYSVAHEALRNEIITAGKGAALDFATVNALEFLDEHAGRSNLELRLTKLLRAAADKHLVAAEVLGADGKTLVRAGPARPVPLSRLSDLDGPQVITDDRRGIICAAPVSYDGVRLGFVVFSYSRDALDQAARLILQRSGSILGGLVFFTSALLLFALRRMMRPVVELGHAAQAFARGDYHHRLPAPKSDDEIGRAARSFNNMCDALELHMRFSNAALIDRIRRGGTHEAREHNLSIAFGDAQGYTHWSQRRSPAEIFATLTRYFTCVGQVTVLRHQGIIDKFMGDGVMSHFGLLREQTNKGRVETPYARDAVRAMVTTQLAMRVLSWSIRTFEDAEPLIYRFGIASGRCMVGPVGARDVMLDYSLIGNVVNLAARLEGKAVANGLLIDRFTSIDAGEGYADLVDRGAQDIKGMSQPIRVFSVRGLRDPAEVEDMRRFILERLLTGELLDEIFLGGKPTEAKRRALLDYARQTLTEEPVLPV